MIKNKPLPPSRGEKEREGLYETRRSQMSSQPDLCLHLRITDPLQLPIVIGVEYRLDGPANLNFSSDVVGGRRCLGS